VVVAVQVTPIDDFRSQANIRRKSLFFVKNARQMRIRAHFARVPLTPAAKPPLVRASASAAAK
jgi:hypothetical protein